MSINNARSEPISTLLLMLATKAAISSAGAAASASAAKATEIKKPNDDLIIALSTSDYSDIEIKNICKAKFLYDSARKIPLKDKQCENIISSFDQMTDSLKERYSPPLYGCLCVSG